MSLKRGCVRLRKIYYRKNIKKVKNNKINSLALIYIYPSINRKLGHTKGFEFLFCLFAFFCFLLKKKNLDDGIIV